MKNHKAKKSYAIFVLKGFTTGSIGFWDPSPSVPVSVFDSVKRKLVNLKTNGNKKILKNDNKTVSCNLLSTVYCTDVSNLTYKFLRSKKSSLKLICI